jgi:hypothetical protein
VRHESSASYRTSLRFGGYLFATPALGHVPGRTPDDKAYKSLTVYSEVLQKVQQDYVDEPICIW